MDMIDILGSLLGQKSSGGGAGADILKDILTGGRPKGQAPGPAKPPAQKDLDAQARELEDLLNVANERNTARTGQAPGQAPRQPQFQPPPRQSQPTEPFPFPNDSPRQRGSAGLPEMPAAPAERQNTQAMVLVRAMVNAAKSDGQISKAEQQSILDRLDNPSPDVIQFLREEFNKPLDVREFAWSVPVGMEAQVYSMSVIAIDVDSTQEDQYLKELAHGLRLTPEACRQIEQRMGVGR
jgi:hypothetical protein